jgi:hypothetical protein
VSDHRGQVIGVVIYVMAVGNLRGPAVPAPVGGDDPVTVGQEEHQLGVSVIGRQRPPVAAHDRLPRAPVLVEDFRTVGRSNGGHCEPPLNQTKMLSGGEFRLPEFQHAQLLSYLFGTVLLGLVINVVASLLR